MTRSRNAYDEDVSDNTSEDIDSNLDTGLSEEEEVDINTNESVELSDGSSQNNLELVNEGGNLLDSAVVLGDVV